MRKIAFLTTLVVCLFSPGLRAAFDAKNAYMDGKIPTYSAGAKILVLPLNPNQVLTEEEIPPVEREIIEQLKKARTEPVLATIKDKKERFSYMLISSKRSFAIPEARNAKEQYAASLASGYDLVIMPSVYEGVGVLKDDSLRFQGAKIELVFKGSIGGDWSGKQIGTALRYEVFNAEGQWLMAVQGGIAMPTYVDVRNKEFIRKDNIFASKDDQKTLSKGVKILMRALVKKLKFKK